MSTRSERARRRAARQRNQRLAIIAIILIIIAITAFFIWQSRSTTEQTTSDLITTSSGLHYQDLVVGSGEVAENGDTVSVHYTGWLEDGTKFDSSLDRNQPFEFTLGQGQVIPGWEQGIQGMKVGGKRRLTIPAELAYGKQEYGGVIPPNATLVFEVELLAIK